MGRLMANIQCLELLEALGINLIIINAWAREASKAHVPDSMAATAMAHPHRQQHWWDWGRKRTQGTHWLDWGRKHTQGTRR